MIRIWQFSQLPFLGGFSLPYAAETFVSKKGYGFFPHGFSPPSIAVASVPVLVTPALVVDVSPPGLPEGFAFLGLPFPAIMMNSTTMEPQLRGCLMGGK